MKMEPATLNDVYDCLRYREWKSGGQIVDELKEAGKDLGSIQHAIYPHLRSWEREGLVESRWVRREETLVASNIPRKVYRRISTGIPKELERAGGLEGLLPALAK